MELVEPGINFFDPREAVRLYDLLGSRSLQKTTILILAHPISPVMDHFDLALKLLAAGQLDEARIYLEELLRQDPDNPDILYNLGLCYLDLDPLYQVRELLHRGL